MLLNTYIAYMLYKSYNAAHMKPLPLQTTNQLADHLRSFRKTRGLTQAQLGRLVGIDQTRMARIEKNPDRVSVNALLKLLAALRVRVLLQPLDAPRTADHHNADW